MKLKRKMVNSYLFTKHFRGFNRNYSFKIKDYFNKLAYSTNSLNIIKGSARSTSEFNIGNYIYIALKNFDQWWWAQSCSWYFT